MKVVKKRKKINYRRIFIITLSIIFIFLLFIIISPKIKINGKRVIEVNYESKYKDKGAKATFLGKDKTNDLVIKDNVNTKKLGDYKVTYKLNYLIPFSKSRTVRVKDLEEPVITLVGDKKTYVCPNTKYEDQGASAIDNYDGDITKKIKVDKDLENNTILYSVTDSSNNTASVKRKLIYKDVDGPVIELNGSREYSLRQGNSYTDPGYKAIDNCDGDISDKVIVEGGVDSNTPGEYIIKYTVTDSANNTTTVERKIVVSKVFTDYGVRKPGVIYLTFDDGPQEGTTDVILDILKEEGVKATFFVTCKGPDYLIKREYDEGHTVALHTATHDYAIVYESDDAYFNDLAKVHDRVQNITGYDSRIIRFPGGSSNTISRRYSQGIMTRVTSEVLNRGYRYYDWNISSGDAGATTDPNEVYSNVVNSLSHEKVNMVLMHDIKSYTRDALRNIIKYGKDNGYTFEAITMDTAMVRQGVNN